MSKINLQRFGERLKFFWVSLWIQISNQTLCQNAREAEESTVNVKSFFARALIRQAGLYGTIVEPLIVLDNACGSSSISAEIYDLLNETAKEHLKLICSDKDSLSFHRVQQRIEECGWRNAEAIFANAEDTQPPSSHFSHIFTGFAIYLTNGTATLNECYRILQPNGICAFSTFSRIGWVRDLNEAIATLPGHPPFPEDKQMLAHFKSQWCDPEHFRQALSNHGFKDVTVEVLARDWVFGNADALWDRVAATIALLQRCCWTDEQNTRCAGLVEKAMKRHLNRKYGKGKPIRTQWAAILATARKPLRG